MSENLCYANALTAYLSVLKTVIQDYSKLDHDDLIRYPSIKMNVHAINGISCDNWSGMVPRKPLQLLFPKMKLLALFLCGLCSLSAF